PPGTPREVDQLPARSAQLSRLRSPPGSVNTASRNSGGPLNPESPGSHLVGCSCLPHAFPDRSSVLCPSACVQPPCRANAGRLLRLGTRIYPSPRSPLGRLTARGRRRTLARAALALHEVGRMHASPGGAVRSAARWPNDRLLAGA